MDFVLCASNLRANAFGIDLQVLSLLTLLVPRANAFDIDLQMLSLLTLLVQKHKY